VRHLMSYRPNLSSNQNKSKEEGRSTSSVLADLFGIYPNALREHLDAIARKATSEIKSRGAAATPPLGYSRRARSWSHRRRAFIQKRSSCPEVPELSATDRSARQGDSMADIAPSTDVVAPEKSGCTRAATSAW